ncbi:hypothetical protein [Phenylobacterium sp.]|uniref:hypothetical protein n=1 Tax=Phenylobacterium sp. TaxID=1871053 RepID=UPI00272FFA31|nr:hypothetical protein [Phenylobacterium sp.]MDP1616935.1 hypothetical protein [Phenylobacterium sp.]MDP1986639.1 hypothetical protein [Phenylobacterium sp.]
MIRAAKYLLALGLLAVSPSTGLAQEGGWVYRADADPAELGYAGPDGQGVQLVLSCSKDSRQITAYFPTSRTLAVRNENGRWFDDVGRPAPWPVSVTLRSGEAATTIPGEASPGPSPEGSAVRVEFADRAPVAENFARSGEFSVAALGSVIAPPAAPRRDVRSFLRYCR